MYGERGSTPRARLVMAPTSRARAGLRRTRGGYCGQATVDHARLRSLWGFVRRCG